MAWTDEMDGLAGAVTDAFGVSVTYRAVTPGAFNTATGATAQTTTDTTIAAVRGRTTKVLTANEILVEGVVWFVAVDQVAAPKNGDQILDGGRGYRIIEVHACLDRSGHDLVTVKSQ